MLWRVLTKYIAVNIDNMCTYYGVLHRHFIPSSKMILHVEQCCMLHHKDVVFEAMRTGRKNRGTSGWMRGTGNTAQHWQPSQWTTPCLKHAACNMMALEAAPSGSELVIRPTDTQKGLTIVPKCLRLRGRAEMKIKFKQCKVMSQWAVSYESFFDESFPDL